MKTLENPYLLTHPKKELAKCPKAPRGVWELWERVAEVWNGIPSEVCQNVIESVPRELEAVIKAKGGHTKYENNRFWCIDTPLPYCKWPNE